MIIANFIRQKVDLVFHVFFFTKSKDGNNYFIKHFSGYEDVADNYFIKSRLGYADVVFNKTH